MKVCLFIHRVVRTVYMVPCLFIFCFWQVIGAVLPAVLILFLAALRKDKVDGTQAILGRSNTHFFFKIN